MVTNRHPAFRILQRPIFLRRLGCVALFISALLLTSASPNSQADAAEKDGPIVFRRDIALILETHCIRCHNSNTSKGDLSLATIDGLRDAELIVPGKPDQSHLLTVIIPDGDKPPAMPKGEKPLTPQQVDLLRRWISAGASWPKDIVLRLRSKADSAWWSLQAVANEDPPKTQSTSTNPIDHFIRARLDEKQLTPSPIADRRTLIRRLYYDLLGIPPTPTAVERFVADPNLAAYEHLVDELLASKHLGERWARHWLDISHYADTHGFERDKLRNNAWHFRDYVIRAFNEDKPYDRFLLEQIAGDVIDEATPESIVATGFLAAGPWDFVGQVETKSPILNRSARALDLDDMLTQVMTATTGMTVNCARCHDHKLDPITQREYYQLASVFAGLRRDERDISPQLRQQFEADRKRLTEGIRHVSSQIGVLRGKGLNLADIVGGGNGYGDGRRGIGLDARTGKVQERPFGDLGNVKPGNYAACDYPFVDGVFVPASGETKISSTALMASELPQNSGKAWDMIRNGPVSSQFSTTLGNVDYNSDGHSMIGLHANAGITFDLAAIRQTGFNGRPTDKTQKGPKTTRPAAAGSDFHFSTTVGYGGRTVEPSAEFRVYLDGELRATARLGRNDTRTVELDIPAAAQFLTLISTDGGNGYGNDQISFGDPRLTLATPAAITNERREQIARLEKHRESLEAQLQILGEPPVFYGVVAEQPPATHILIRGNPEAAGDPVEPGALGFGRQPSIFGNHKLAEAERRLALARWIIDPDHPLTRRVIVNRLWHWHFGRGLVDTPSDFGYGGGRPSHPKLLDWLADELLRSGWSLKHIHRLIVTSQTYRQQSTGGSATITDGAESNLTLPNRNPASIDADNRLLWRRNPHRLEAEAVRDAVLAVTGKLNVGMFGPGYRDFDYQEEYAPIYTYRTADSPPLWRRSIYRFIVRTTPQQFMTALDCPDPANLTPQRNVTTTALQSLALYNNDFMLRQSRYFAARLEQDAGSNIQKLISRAFQLAFSRPPDQREIELSKQMIDRQGLWQFCRALLNANEFVYID